MKRDVHSSLGKKNKESLIDAYANEDKTIDLTHDYRDNNKSALGAIMSQKSLLIEAEKEVPKTMANRKASEPIWFGD